MKHFNLIFIFAALFIFGNLYQFIFERVFGC